MASRFRLTHCVYTVAGGDPAAIAHVISGECGVWLEMCFSSFHSEPYYHVHGGTRSVEVFRNADMEGELIQDSAPCDAVIIDVLVEDDAFAIFHRVMLGELHASVIEGPVHTDESGVEV